MDAQDLLLLTVSTCGNQIAKRLFTSNPPQKTQFHEYERTWIHLIKHTQSKRINKNTEQIRMTVVKGD